MAEQFPTYDEIILPNLITFRCVAILLIIPAFVAILAGVYRNCIPTHKGDRRLKVAL